MAKRKTNPPQGSDRFTPELNDATKDRVIGPDGEAPAAEPAPETEPTEEETHADQT